MAFDIRRLRFPRAQGGPRARWMWLVFSSFIVLLLGYNSCTTYIRPGELGVKQISWGLHKGIEPHVYDVGLHYVGAGEKMHRFPARVQVLELTSSASEATRDLEGHRVTSAINIQT